MISDSITQGYQYINSLVGGNEFASGLILGGITASATYLAKDIPRRMFLFLKKHLTTTLTVHSSQESFHKLMKYFQKQGLSDKSRAIRFSNGMYGDNSTTKTIGYGNHLFYFEFMPILINISYEEGNTGTNLPKEKLSMTILGRSHRLFNSLIDKVEDKKTNITKYFNWDHGLRFITEQPKVSLKSVVLSDNDKQNLTYNIDNFITKEDFYLDKGIPYQLGILLHGPPGTGKTSLVRAIAGYLNKNVVLVSSVTELISASKSVKDAIICVEEVDTLGADNREEDENDLLRDFKSFNLGQMLTSLDGLVPNHGRIIIMTTNHIERLDQALLRPGRIDISLYMGYLTIETFRELLRKFDHNPDLSGKTMSGDYSPAVVQCDLLLGLSTEEIINKYTS